ncbi:RIMS-binding protein 2 isoform X7 [Xenopus tropicalis]|uniref:RIMS-binding protein 2 n=1 Tax=Xenopus tropicalis TaxID=8364 RepID=A0A8J1JK95_XENTR|nr:RIMS-binding protein 2 isoform X7 [Xenopus tropicalis]
MGWKLSLFHNRMFMLDWYHVTPMLSSLVSHAKIRLGSEPLSQASGSTLAPVQQLKSVSFSAIGRHVPIAHVTFDLRNPGAFIATNQFIGFNKPASLYILIFLTILIMKEEPKEVSSNRKDTVNTEKRNDHDLTLQESLQTDTKVEKSNSTREKEKKRPQKPESSKVGERASKLQGQRAPTKNTEKANAPVSTKTKQKKTSSASSAKRPSTKQTMRSVIGGPGHPPCPSKDSEREVEIRLLQVECDELRNRLGCLKEGLMGQKPSDVEQLLRQSQKELLWLQRQLSFISNGGPACILSPNKFRNDLQCLPPSVQHRSYSHIQFLEEKSRPFKSDVTSVSPEKLHWNFLEDELKDVVQDKSRLSLQYASLSHRALLYDQVKSDYEQLRETLVIVTRERDLAVKEKYQLQAKLENLEQVLKHMREAAERRQQLELEHEQALAVLNAKQQEIDLLQKAQVEAKIEHEGAVQLLENTLDSMQAKVRELEEKCRTQSEQFNLLSRELEKFRQQAGKIDLLSGNAGGVLDFPGSPNKTLTQFINGIATSISKGNESPTGSRSVISEYIRPLQITGDKPEQLCVKPTFLSRSRSGSPRRGFECNMDKEQNTNTSKQRYSGKVHLCIARYSYNPFDGPNENPEAELPLVAGKYLYVYGDMDEDGFYEGELLDGQRGLVPSNFVDFVQNDEFHMSSTLASEQEENILNHSAPLLQSELKLEITPSIHMESSVLNNGTGTTMDVNIDEIGEDIVPYPRKITLIKQLAKSVIVGWEPPLVPPGWGTIHSYNVLIGKEIRATLNFGSRTKLLLEKLDLATVTYRLSIQTVTDRGNSDELQCSLLVGKDVIVAPTHLKVDNITPMSAELIWLPSNSNYSHVIFLNDEEYDIVKAASYRYHFFNLKPNMTYKVKLLAKPHQMPWQLPLEQRERKEAYTEFTTLPSGPPIPPDNVIVHQGPTPVTLLVTWKPPVLSPTGTSNGAHVTGFSVYARGQKVAEVVFPAAENIVVDLLKLLNLDAKEVTVRTLSAQGESEDSISALIPPDLMVPPIQHPRTMPKCKPLATAGVPDTKDDHVCPHRKVDESWEHTRTASPVHGHTLEPPTSNFHSPVHGRRSPSPQRILPQPQGAPVSNTMAKAMAREAAQRVAESTRNEKRSLFSERSNSVHYANSDEEEDGYDSPHIKRKGASVDEFLKGSELGKQSHYCPGEDYHTESSRGSDLSDILEEDEEELYSEMQLEDGGRRRVSITSHNTLKCSKTSTTDPALKEQLDYSPQHHHSKKLFSIPEVAEEEGGEHSELLHRGCSIGITYKTRGALASVNRIPRAGSREGRHQSPWHLSKARFNGTPTYSEDFTTEGSKLGSLSRSPDSGLDCGSEEEEARCNYRKATVARNAAQENPQNPPCPRDLKQMLTRRKTLTRQSSVEEDFGDMSAGFVDNKSNIKHQPEMHEQQPCIRDLNNISARKTDFYQKDHRDAVLRPPHRDTENSLLLGNHPTLSRTDHQTRRFSHGSAAPQRPRPMMVPSIEITMDSNSEGGRSRSGSEGNISPVKEEAYYRSLGGHRKWSLQPTRVSDDRYDSYGSREQLSMYEESETDGGMEDFPARIFVALFDYDPRTMSPNPDAAEEELPFKEGQVIKVYGDKDSDGFYRGETCERAGFIPCNMVSEIQVDDEEMMEQLFKQGFLPLNTPVEKIVNCERFKESSRSVHRRSRKSKRERNRRSGRQHSVTTRRMVALYDYDPRESSPNVDVEAELTFCTGDILNVFGEIDEDGFYYGELNGHKGLVPSNFLEEVPDDVEVYLSDTPSRYPQDTPMRTKVKRKKSVHFTP